MKLSASTVTENALEISGFSRRFHHETKEAREPAGGKECGNRKTLAIAHPDPGFHFSVRDLLDIDRRWTHVGSYPGINSVLQEIARLRPGILLMGARNPDGSMLETLVRLLRLQPGIRVVLMVEELHSLSISDLVSAGVCGVLLPRDLQPRLLGALDDVNNGGLPISSFLTRKLVRDLKSSSLWRPELSALTPRERECLGHLATGDLYKEIADKMGVGIETVRTHVSKIYSKLDVRTRTEAAVRFLSVVQG